MTAQVLDIAVRAFIPAVALGVLTWVGMWIKRVYDQKKSNEVQAIQLEGEQIELKNKEMPIDDLIKQSNIDHGVLPGSSDSMGPKSGNKAPKG